ncbi:hypothetical protein C8J57DRAFT_1356447 [Mycena rebaudengoi]|nr:hypothetical protein C8J57DRAFT_1356447 [Mycena rebaudengoi]
MKLCIVPLLALGAGLASASPPRAMLISSHMASVDDAGPQRADITLQSITITSSTSQPPCGGAARRFRQKAHSISLSFMQALGFASPPTKATAVPHNMLSSPPVRIGRPGGTVALPPVMYVKAHPVPAVEPPRMYVHGSTDGAHGHFHRFRADSFIMRVHLALMSLGRWEGRAVAFVLGCGLGVLLRMVFVILIVSYRAIRGRSSASRAEDHYYAGVSNEDEFLDAEEIFVAPPLYTFPIEKSEVADAAVVIENK